MNPTVTRRDFLRGTLATAGLTIAASVGPFGYRLANASQGAPAGDPEFGPAVYYRITPDNRVVVSVPSSEMGQGVHTAFAMIVAEELDADWAQMSAVQAQAADAFKSPLLKAQLTVGSASCRGFYEPLRKAGAAGRAVLVRAAAQTWGVPEAECRTQLGTVRHEPSGRSLTYGQLCGAAARLEVPQDPPLKAPGEFRYLGKPMARLDIPPKVAGTAVFGLDVAVEGLHYAVLARPPAYGAKPVSFDQAGAEQVPGVVKVVPLPQGVAVCATSTEAALRGRDALKVQWDAGLRPDLDDAAIEKQLTGDLDRPGGLALALDQGDARTALAGAATALEQSYFVPFVAHATMEPMNCTAHVQADRCDLWVPTQAQTTSQAVAAKISGLPPEKVRVHTTYLGCGLGRRARPDFVAEAVMVSKATGKPVKLTWTREDDIRHDAFRSAMAHRIRAGVDASGQLVGWFHQAASVSILKGINADLVKDGVDWYCLWGLWDKPDSPHWNNKIQYELPNLRIEFAIADLPMPVAPWRSVQNACNAFAIESYVDELARAAGKDPLEFRLQNLKNNLRARRVLEVAAEKAGWGKPLPAGRGRGIAQHACFGTWTAQVAELSVDRETGKVTVHRAVVAVDCGPVVNPDPLVAQIEGGVIMALSTALKEQVHFAKGGVASANFDDYPLLRLSEVPEIEVHIVPSTEKIGGIGELGVPALAPAVANAFTAATGVRVRRIPLDPATVKAALKAG